MGPICTITHSTRPPCACELQLSVTAPIAKTRSTVRMKLVKMAIVFINYNVLADSDLRLDASDTEAVTDARGASSSVGGAPTS